MSCDKHDTQHPCWFAKVKVWQTKGGLRAMQGLKGDGLTSVPDYSAAWAHSIPTDSRGMPFLGSNLDPLTAAQMQDIGHRKIEKRRRELHQGHLDSQVITSDI